MAYKRTHGKTYGATTDMSNRVYYGNETEIVEPINKESNRLGSALIKTLKTFMGINDIYPITLTKAVYDENGNRLDNTLKANGKNFFFDYHDGKYGFNTDSSRGADTFHPFSVMNASSLINSANGDTLTATNMTVGKPYYLFLSAGSSSSNYVNNRCKITSISGCTTEVIEQKSEFQPNHGIAYMAYALYKIVPTATSITIKTGSDSFGSSAKLLFD